jgi:hypothetical protein
VFQNKCGACLAPNPLSIQSGPIRQQPQSNGSEGLFNKCESYYTRMIIFTGYNCCLVPIISNTVAKFDSVIDAISSQLNSISERNQLQIVDNWLCPKCNLINGPTTRYCTTCAFDREFGESSFLDNIINN